MSASLELEPEPRSVGQARAWVCRELNRIGRQDLRDAAELCVSELVTNALLHSEPPISVRLIGTAANPRIEVHDASTTAPALRDMTRDGRETATVGRGLGIVATFSRSWGADISENGKSVWFEPVAESEATEDGSEAGMLGDLFDIEALLAETAEAADEPARHTVRLRNMPIPLIARYQIWFEDLAREMRLLALMHSDETPLALDLAGAVHDMTEERRHFTGLDRIEAALQANVSALDVDLEVPPSAGDTMHRLLLVLERADEYCRAEETLTLPPDTGVVEVRTWYHTEFVRQIHGEPPRPWTTPAVTEHP